MASVIVTFNIMPEGTDVNLEEIKEVIKGKIKDFAGEGYDEESDLKIEIVDVAFGLKALDIKLILDESRGSPDKLEEDFNAIDGIKSVEVTDVRRIIG